MLFPPKTLHFNERKVPFIIIHGTAVNTLEAEKVFEGKHIHIASVHYYIKQDGNCLQYLDESVRAYHAGLGWWGGVEDVNSLSIGIELECLSADSTFSNPEESIYTSKQMHTLKNLVRGIAERHKVKPWHILAHQDVSADRRHLLPPEVLTQPNLSKDATGKLDPGPFFNWAELAKHGLGLWHNQPPDVDDAPLSPTEEKAFLNLLFLYGYDPRVIGPKGHGSERVIKAFQTHFMPWLFGTPLFGKATKQTHKIAQILWAEKTKF